MFGKKITAPRIANNANAKKQAIAVTFPRIKEAIKRLLAVPRSAPRINGIAFFKLINRIAAKGTNRPIVMLEENKIAVNITPRKYDLYFELK